jgi:hypothetical protein
VRTKSKVISLAKFPEDCAPPFIPFDPTVAAGHDQQAPFSDDDTIALYNERLTAGLCPMCARPYGLPFKERFKLPRVDGEPGRWREPTWVFLGPCGHRIMAIAKDSPLARRYGFAGGGGGDG